MSNNHKRNELSLAERLLQVYERSNTTLDFSETKNELARLRWVEEIMKRLKENDLRANSDDT